MMSTTHWAARALIAIAAVALMQGCAWAGNSSCPNQYELYGMLMRSSLLCNTPMRPAISKTISTMQRDCPTMDKASIAKGFTDFDRETKKQGFKQACAGIDKFMSSMEAHDEAPQIERRPEPITKGQICEEHALKETYPVAIRDKCQGKLTKECKRLIDGWVAAAALKKRYCIDKPRGDLE